MATKQKRMIIKIDEEKCDGCGQCVPACAEGALQIIDGKAKLVSEKYCDGLGACLGDCPRGAISMEEREADGFDEEAVKVHLEEKEKGQEKPEKAPRPHFGGCPSSRVMEFKRPHAGDHEVDNKESAPSMLAQWPVKIALVPPGAPFLENADLVLAADCAPFAYADFHNDFLKDNAVIIGCPKLDDPDFYREKITEILRNSNIRSVIVAHMEVPCCHALYAIAEEAVKASGKDIPLKKRVIGIRGEEKEEKHAHHAACNHDH